MCSVLVPALVVPPFTISDLLTVETAADFYQTMSLLSAHLKKGKIVSSKEFMEVSNDTHALTDQHSAWHDLVCHVSTLYPIHSRIYTTHPSLSPSSQMHLTHPCTPHRCTSPIPQSLLTDAPHLFLSPSSQVTSPTPALLTDAPHPSLSPSSQMHLTHPSVPPHRCT